MAICKSGQGGSHPVTMLHCAELLAISIEGLPECARLVHPWVQRDRLRVCPGQIHLNLQNEHLTLFTFGGDLLAQAQLSHTLFSLISSAPILWMEKFNQLSTTLADEVEILLARKISESKRGAERYTRKLAEVEPFAIYCACLETLFEEFAEFDGSLEMPIRAEFVDFIQAEIKDIKSHQQWPDAILDLAKLA